MFDLQQFLLQRKVISQAMAEVLVPIESNIPFVRLTIHPTFGYASLLQFSWTGDRVCVQLVSHQSEQQQLFHAIRFAPLKAYRAFFRQIDNLNPPVQIKPDAQLGRDGKALCLEIGVNNSCSSTFKWQTCDTPDTWTALDNLAETMTSLGSFQESEEGKHFHFSSEVRKEGQMQSVLWEVN